MSDERAEYDLWHAAHKRVDDMFEQRLLERCLAADAAVVALAPEWPRISAGYKVRANAIRAALERTERALGVPYLAYSARISDVLANKQMPREDRAVAIDTLTREMDAALVAVPDCADD